MNDPVNWIDPPGLLMGIDAGESYGEDSAMYYAQITNDPCASWLEKGGAWAGGLLSSLWTPETSDKTAMVLASPYLARGVGAAALAVNRGVIIGGVRVIQIHKHSLSMKILMSAGYSRKAAGAIRNTPLWHANWGKSGHLIFRKIISGIFGK